MEKKYFCAISLILLQCNNNNNDLKKKTFCIQLPLYLSNSGCCSLLGPLVFVVKQTQVQLNYFSCCHLLSRPIAQAMPSSVWKIALGNTCTLSALNTKLSFLHSSGLLKLFINNNWKSSFNCIAKTLQLTHWLPCAPECSAVNFWRAEWFNKDDLKCLKSSVIL